MQGDKFEAITINSEIPLSGQCFAEMPASSFVPSLFSLWTISIAFEVTTAEARICECWETSSSEQGKTFVLCSQAEQWSRQKAFS